MAVLAKFGLLALGIGTPLATGAYYLLENINRPRSFSERLLRGGQTLIASGEDNKWRAKFADFGADMKDKVEGITNVEDTSNIEQQVNKLKEWCEKGAQKGASESGYEDYSNFCSTELRSLKGKMISEGIEMASSDDDWKTLFLYHKHGADFLAKLNELPEKPNPAITATSSVDTAKDRLSQYCSSILNVAPSGNNQDLAKKWCVKSGATTVEARLASLPGFSKPGESDYETLATTWANNENFKSTALKDQTATDNKGKLKKYCEGEFAKSLTGLSNYDTDMKNIFNFCNKSITTGTNLQDITWPA